jgi:uncharacterized membrane protein YkvA (DUF1232 family)
VERLRKTWRKFNRRFAEEAAELLAAPPFGMEKEEAEKHTCEILEWLECVPNIMLLVGNLMIDDRVPADGKVRIGMLIFYILSPLDLLPMWMVGPIGSMDDVMVFLYLMFVITSWLASLGEEIIYENWTGEQKQIDKIMSVVSKVGDLGVLGDVLEKGMRLIPR